MKNPERAAELLAELRELADNDFERHRIDVLEQDLSEPSQVEIIDSKHQRFNGVLYTKDRTGHYRSTFHIHREIWNYYYGELPDNCHIHHINGNPANNDIRNLQCLSASEHLKQHKQQGEPAAQRTKNPNIVCAHCGKTFKHSSPNKKYCSEQCKAEHNLIYKCCPVCGKTFSTEKKHKHQVFCSIHCFMIDRYSKRI